MRDAAARSVKSVAEVLPDDVFQDKYASMLAEMATEEWFTARISAASLLASAYTRMKSDQQLQSLKHFGELCRDDAPMVRRVAAQNLGAMLEAVVKVGGRTSLAERDSVVTHLVPLYEDVASNEQPVRLC